MSEIKRERIAWLNGAVEGITLYAIWKDGVQQVGSLARPLNEVLKPYQEEITRLRGEIERSKQRPADG